MKLNRLLVASALSLSCLPALAQDYATDPIAAQIEADYVNWVRYLDSRLNPGLISLEDYREQMRNVKQNYETRRNIRQAELARAREDRALREREVKALEAIGNSFPSRCLRDSSGNLHC